MNYEPAIFLFIDALGWEVVEQTGFLQNLLPYRRKVAMQFGYSSSAIPTILSGQPPAVHKHLGLFRFAPPQSPFRWMRWLSPLLKPASLWNRGRVRHWLSRLVGKLCGFTGYFQLYRVPFSRLAMMDYCEKKDLFVSGGMEEVENLCDLLNHSGRRFHISDWRLSDQRNFAEARKALAQGAEFLFIYTAGLDAVLHQSPDPKSEAVKAKLEWYRREIEALLGTCREAGQIPRLTVISDHGMTPLKRTADLKAAVEATGLVFGRDYGACYDSTMLRVNFLKPNAEAAIRAALRPFETYGHWLSAEEEK
ncbi:MAG: alkaline phosphatase family protein, partial [Victivallales bacterium]|nr:alkaline phosphatase family protein [Victivallales bacterium]